MLSPKPLKSTHLKRQNEVTDLLNVIAMVSLLLPLSTTYRLEHNHETKGQNDRNHKSSGLMTSTF